MKVVYTGSAYEYVYVRLSSSTLTDVERARLKGQGTMPWFEALYLVRAGKVSQVLGLLPSIVSLLLAVLSCPELLP